MKKLSKNKIISLILILFCIFWFYKISGLPQTTVQGAPDSAFFPLVVTSFLLLLSILLFFKKEKDMDEEEAQGSVQAEAVPSEDSAFICFLKNKARPYFMFLVILVYIILVPRLGFFVATFISLTVILFINGKLRPLDIFITSFATSSLVFLIFKIALRIPLPGGLLF